MAATHFAEVDERRGLCHRRVVLEEVEVQRSTVGVLELQQHNIQHVTGLAATNVSST